MALALPVSESHTSYSPVAERWQLEKAAYAQERFLDEEKARQLDAFWARMLSSAGDPTQLAAIQKDFDPIFKSFGPVFYKEYKQYMEGQIADSAQIDFSKLTIAQLKGLKPLAPTMIGYLITQKENQLTELARLASEKLRLTTA